MRATWSRRSANLGCPGWVAEQELVGGHQRAELECPPADRSAAFEVRELEAAATDVDEVAGIDRQPVDRAEKRVARLLVAVDHLDREPGVRLEPGEDAVAIGRGPDRGGGDGDGPLRARGCRHGSEVAHGRRRSSDCARFQSTSGVDVTRELERRPSVRDDVELARAVESQDCDSGGVRSDVDDGDRGFYGGHLPGTTPGGSGKYRQHGLFGVQSLPINATSVGATSASETIRSSR